MKKSILIVLPNALDPTSGGLERVYHNLTPFFRAHGYEVYATYTKKSDYDNHSVYNGAYYCPHRGCSDGYINDIADVLATHHFDYIINSYTDYRTLRYASSLKGVNVMHHIHNIPSVYLYTKINIMPKKLVGSLLDRLARKIRFNIRLRPAFNNINRNNQKVVLLSESFREDLNSVYPVKRENVYCIANPFPTAEQFDLDNCKKEKVILFVGRMSELQKRISSVLNIWKMVQGELPDYRLDMVGDGPDRARFENKAQEMGLQRIKFYGFKNPTEFYKRSMVSIMTSNFEGFGMVLVEAMQYGCVPFAFDTFTALHDIIDDGVNGIIIPPPPSDQEDVHADQEYAHRLLHFLRQDESKIRIVQKNAIQKSHKFDVDNIGAKWLSLLKSFPLKE